MIIRDIRDWTADPRITLITSSRFSLSGISGINRVTPGYWKGQKGGWKTPLRSRGVSTPLFRPRLITPITRNGLHPDKCLNVKCKTNQS